MTSYDNTPVTPALPDLPERLKKIEAHWPVLPSGIWNSSSIQSLSRHLHELVRRSEDAGDETLFDLVTAIDESITQIIDDNAPPGNEQLEALERQLDRLRALASGPTKPLPATTPVTPAPETTLSPYDVVILSETDTLAEGLAEEMNKRGLSHLKTTDPELLQLIIVGPGTKLLLIDAALLREPALEPILHLLKSNRAAAPALFVIADQSTIEVRLSALRAGASHLFTRPVDSQQLAGHVEKQLRPTPQPRHRVLIVEDDESQAKFAAKLLQKGGFEPLAITDPLGVIDAVVHFEPDLILMDLYMPGADGVELTRVIRDRWESSGIPVVFLSGEDDPEKKQLALLAGADDFLTKPVRPQQLLATIHPRIDRARQIATVAVKQAVEASSVADRRTLLNRLDLILADEGEASGFQALLAISLGDQATADSEADAPAQSLIKLIQGLLEEGDLLAAFGTDRLAVLSRREDEQQLEEFAERIYSLLSEAQAPEKPWHVGIGMVLLDNAGQSAYRRLCNAEACAESAYQGGTKGFALYGETPPGLPDAPHPAPEKQADFLKAIKEGAIPFRRQRYQARQDTGCDTVELITIPGPYSLDEDPYRLAASSNLAAEFDRSVCLQALQALGEQVAHGRRGRMIFRQSVSAVSDPGYPEFIRTELRRHQIVGTGLMVELDLPALAANLKAARTFIGELAGLGMTVALGNFACNETAYKVLAYLRADAIRPHRSLLRIQAERIQHIAQQIHSLKAEIILPRVASHGEIALPWTEFADLVQADFGQ